MNDLVTLTTFTYPHEAAVIKGRLQAEGIDCFIKDDLTAQVNPLYSNAIGGVKLMVRANDFLKAAAILEESGLDRTGHKRNSPLLGKILSFTSNIPWVKGLQAELQLLLLVGVITTIVMLIIYAVTQ